MAMSPKITSTETLVVVVEFGKMLGLTIGEMPPYGTVHQVHGKGSFHYDSDNTVNGKKHGHAADVNLNGAGVNPVGERARLTRLLKVARSLGLAVTFALEGTKGSAAGHQNHLHIDVGSWSNIGKGLIKASKVTYGSHEKVTVDITDARLMVRNKAGLKGIVVTKFSKGVSRNVTSFAVADGILWGRVAEGWIALVNTKGFRYVKVSI